MGQSESTPMTDATTIKSRGLGHDTTQENTAADSKKKEKEPEPSFYKLDLASMDDELYQNHIPAQEWMKTVTSVTAKSGFPTDSLNEMKPIEPILEAERFNGIALYMAWNVMPFLIPILLLGCLFSVIARWVLGGLAMYVSILYAIQYLYFTPHFVKLYKSTPLSPKTMKANQYIYTERNSSKYCSTQFVWPASLHRPALVDKPVIYCVIPHGVVPIGVTPYAIWSKVWNDKLCHFTCAPIVLKIPIVAKYMKLLGYIPAKSAAITETLTKKEENVGIILDGIEGMFSTDEKEEIAVLQKRKGIVKIALRAGVPIIPVYGFGHTKLYTILQDPFGILKELSIALETALTPFFGRFGWFLGPPHRVPVTVCLGEPVNCPLISEPTKDDVNKYHKQLLDNFVQVFEQHKSACGYGDKKLKIV